MLWVRSPKSATKPKREGCITSLPLRVMVYVGLPSVSESVTTSWPLGDVMVLSLAAAGMVRQRASAKRDVLKIVFLCVIFGFLNNLDRLKNKLLKADVFSACIQYYLSKDNGNRSKNINLVLRIESSFI